MRRRDKNPTLPAEVVEAMRNSTGVSAGWIADRIGNVGTRVAARLAKAAGASRSSSGLWRIG